MLYVSNILKDDNLIEVTDTDDGVSEKIPMSELLGLVSKGLEVSGVFDNQVRICSGDWLEEEFFQYCVKTVNKKFRKTGFKNDTGIFSFLNTEFNSLYKCVKDLYKTPVSSVGMHNFTADCIAQICRLSGISCIVSKSGSISSTSLDNIYSKVYTNIGIVVYISLTSHKRSYKVIYYD